MGSVLINVPDFSDAELVYNEIETRQILKFFWQFFSPSESAAIDGLTINNGARRLAQIALIAAIEGTYAMGFIDILSKIITRRNPSIASLAKKLTRGFVRHWWKHTRQQDLKDVRIYECVRSSVALHLGHLLVDHKNGLALRSSVRHFFAQQSSYTVWA